MTLYSRQSNYGMNTAQPALNVNGYLTATGPVASAMGLLGYSLSYFINGSDQDLSTGQFVSINTDSTVETSSLNDKIPVFKVSKSYAPDAARVCGVVLGGCGMSSDTVSPGQKGLMVMAGAFSLCNVDTLPGTPGAVAIGDLLTISRPTPGYAMKAPDNFSGTFVGKALHPLEAGKKGQIAVLINITSTSAKY